VSRLFNAYVMVDWSAASAPKVGKDSIWIGVLKRDVRFRLAFEAHNPATREEAMTILRGVFAELKRKGERCLAGFDFALGFPAGTAAALGLKQADWAGTWAFLAKDFVDKPNNVNNRFAIANKMNRLMTNEARPFWGAPPKDVQTWLSATKPTAAKKDLPPLRAAEKLAKAKSVWQLSGAGAVGGQTLTGIPRVKTLADSMGDAARVWPFQTGWRALSEADLEGVDVLFAEVYPALVTAKAEAGEIIDRAQVRALAEHFAKLDEQGKLGAAFGPQAAASLETAALVETEEGWILGI
jgi:hypothetical protein